MSFSMSILVHGESISKQSIGSIVKVLVKFLLELLQLRRAFLDRHSHLMVQFHLFTKSPLLLNCQILQSFQAVTSHKFNLRNPSSASCI